MAFKMSLNEPNLPWLELLKYGRGNKSAPTKAGVFDNLAQGIRNTGIPEVVRYLGEAAERVGSPTAFTDMKNERLARMQQQIKMLGGIETPQGKQAIMEYLKEIKSSPELMQALKDYTMPKKSQYNKRPAWQEGATPEQLSIYTERMATGKEPEGPKEALKYWMDRASQSRGPEFGQEVMNPRTGQIQKTPALDPNTLQLAQEKINYYLEFLKQKKNKAEIKKSLVDFKRTKSFIQIKPEHSKEISIAIQNGVLSSDEVKTINEILMENPEAIDEILTRIRLKIAHLKAGK